MKLEPGQFYRVKSDIPITVYKMGVGAPADVDLKLIKVTRGGMAMVKDPDGNVYQVAPRHIESV